MQSLNTVLGTVLETDLQHLQCQNLYRSSLLINRTLLVPSMLTFQVQTFTICSDVVKRHQ